jgi:hypothetical protein
MGNKIVQYFLHLMKSEPNGQKWLDDHIHTFFAVGKALFSHILTAQLLHGLVRLGYYADW